MGVAIYKDEIDLTKAREIIDHYRGKQGYLMPLLQEIQEAYGYVPRETVYLVQEELNVSAQHIYGVLTFYSQFHLKPRGKYIIRVCRGTACHVNGSLTIVDKVAEMLGLSVKQGKLTTDDLLFTIEEVACIGACALAPLIVVNHHGDEEAYGKVTTKEMETIISELRNAEKQASSVN